MIKQIDNTKYREQAESISSTPDMDYCFMNDLLTPYKLEQSDNPCQALIELLDEFEKLRDEHQGTN